MRHEADSHDDTLVHGVTPDGIDAYYRLGREVAHGGMGAVWEATEAGTGTRVAVKIVADSNRGEMASEVLPSSPTERESHSRQAWYAPLRAR